MTLSPSTLAMLVEIIHAETGIALGADKHYLLTHRLEPVLRAHRLASLDDLVVQLTRRGRAAPLRNDVIEAITIHETSFFRDPDVFAALGRHVIGPGLTQGARSMRLWSSATATGQEAWSLAILVAELLGGALGTSGSRASILASDISQHSVEIARRGHYAAREVARGLSPERARAYMRPIAGGTTFAVVDVLRSLVQFRTFNLMDSPAELGPFDVVLCRNVLIYFDEATRGRVVAGLRSVLAPNGVLVLGAAESLYGLTVPGSSGAVPASALLQAEHHDRMVFYRRVPE